MGRAVPTAFNQRGRAPTEHLPEVDVLCSLVFEGAIQAQSPAVGTGPLAARGSAELRAATRRALPTRTVAVFGVGLAVVLPISLRDGTSCAGSKSVYEK